MDQILGHKPTTLPECVIDSLALTQSEENMSESPEQDPEIPDSANGVDETVFGEDNIADDTVAPVSTDSSVDTT